MKTLQILCQCKYFGFDQCTALYVYQCVHRVYITTLELYAHIHKKTIELRRFKVKMKGRQCVLHFSLSVRSIFRTQNQFE